jgi:hypothetical protein
MLIIGTQAGLNVTVVNVMLNRCDGEPILGLGREKSTKRQFSKLAFSFQC